MIKNLILNNCTYCDLCMQVCPSDALDRQENILTVDTNLCIGCESCINVCPNRAITKEFLGI